MTMGEAQAAVDLQIKMFEDARKCCVALKIKGDIIFDLYTAKSDWEFIIKVDALLEAACKEALKAVLHIQAGRKKLPQGSLDTFIDALPIAGRISITALLKAAKFSEFMRKAIEAIRTLRNAYVHDIRQVGSSLQTVLSRRSDRYSVLKQIIPGGMLDDKGLWNMYEADPKMLRFFILETTLDILRIVYRTRFVKEKSRKTREAAQ